MNSTWHPMLKPKKEKVKNRMLLLVNQTKKEERKEYHWLKFHQIGTQTCGEVLVNVFTLHHSVLSNLL